MRDFAKTSGSRFRTLRYECGFSIDRLSRSAGISPSVIHRFESGMSPISISALDRLTEALGIPMAAFFESGSSRATRQEIAPLMDLRRRVFIVHGHDHAVRETVAEFVTQAGLRPTILQDEPNGGRTIVEKFEDCAAKTDYTIVLITPDDVAFSATDRKNRAFRARQNVILEWGYFLAKLGRRRVCLLYRSGTEIPSDLHGVLYIELDEDGEWRKKILREFQSVGIIPSGKTERRSADDGSPSKRGHGRFCWN